MKWWQHIIICAVTFMIGIVAGALFVKSRHGKPVTTTNTVIKMEVITQWHDRPAPVSLRERKTGRIDTIYLRKDSLIYIHNTDTVGVPLERTQKYYEDSLYRAWVSGINPKLDSIKVAERTISNYVAVPAYNIVHFGPAATYGYDPIRKQGAFVVGASLTVDLQELYKKIVDYRK